LAGALVIVYPLVEPFLQATASDNP
jgi:hypothetical protein